MTLTSAYLKCSMCVVRITVLTTEGDLSIGTGFHIGSGYIVTARHVIDKQRIEAIEGHNNWNPIRLKKVYYPEDDNIDLAVLETDFSLEAFMEFDKAVFGYNKFYKSDHIALHRNLYEVLGGDLVLTKVLLMGYPRIPFSDSPCLVATAGEINAQIGKYNSPYTHFIISAMARGGFSGGPVVDKKGQLIGIVTETLLENNKDLELGFMSAISLEPLLELLNKHRIVPGKNGRILEEFAQKRNESDVDIPY